MQNKQALEYCCKNNENQTESQVCLVKLEKKHWSWSAFSSKKENVTKTEEFWNKPKIKWNWIDFEKLKKQSATKVFLKKSKNELQPKCVLKIKRQSEAEMFLKKSKNTVQLKPCSKNKKNKVELKSF